MISRCWMRLGVPIKDPVGWLIGLALPQRQQCGDARCDERVLLDSGQDCPRCWERQEDRRDQRGAVAAAIDAAMPGASEAERRTATAKHLHQDVTARAWAQVHEWDQYRARQAAAAQVRAEAAAAQPEDQAPAAPVAPVVPPAPRPAAAPAPEAADVDDVQELVLEELTREQVSDWRVRASRTTRWCSTTSTAMASRRPGACSATSWSTRRNASPGSVTWASATPRGGRCRFPDPVATFHRRWPLRGQEDTGLEIMARAGVERGCDAFENPDELPSRDLDHEDRTGVFRVAEQVFLAPELQRDHQAVLFAEQIGRHIVGGGTPEQHPKPAAQLVVGLGLVVPRALRETTVCGFGGQAGERQGRTFARPQPGGGVQHIAAKLRDIRHVVVAGQPLSRCPEVDPAQWAWLADLCGEPEFVSQNHVHAGDRRRFSPS